MPHKRNAAIFIFLIAGILIALFYHTSHSSVRPSIPENGPESCETLMQKANELLWNSHHLEALEKYQEAQECYQQVNDREGEANALDHIGIVYDTLEKHDTALVYFQQALAIWQEIGNHSDEEGITHLRMGDTYEQMGQQENALTYYQQTLYIWRAQECFCREDFPLTDMGLIYFNRGEYRQALRCYQEALEFVQNMHPALASGTGMYGHTTEGRLQARIGITYFVMGIESFQQALICLWKTQLPTAPARLLFLTLLVILLPLIIILPLPTIFGLCTYFISVKRHRKRPRAILAGILAMLFTFSTITSFIYLAIPAIVLVACFLLGA